MVSGWLSVECRVEREKILKPWARAVIVSPSSPVQFMGAAWRPWDEWGLWDRRDLCGARAKKFVLLPYVYGIQKNVLAVSSYDGVTYDDFSAKSGRRDSSGRDK